ncbi:MAG: cation:proton antiporter [Synergistaceae bacterium]|nr:cation:proton antiporter [Synergistaceae bacterium]
MQSLFSLSIAILAGLLMTRILKPCHLPDVTAYLLGGILIGPFCLGYLNIPHFAFHTLTEVHNLSLISDVALGFIAFTIGSEFKFEQLKKTGRATVIVTVLQAGFATICVDVALYLFHLFFPTILSTSQAIMLGAIATATAPAATLMVVRQYKAKGELVNLLLPVVALDDAVGLMVFAVSFGIAKALEFEEYEVGSILLTPTLGIIVSLSLGTICGILLTKLEQLFHSNSNRLSMTIAFIFATVALSKLTFTLAKFELTFSPLLVCMSMGVVFCNICPFAFDIIHRAESWTAPLYAIFFVVSGADLDLAVFKNKMNILVGLCYIVARCLGKYYGAYLGCSIAKVGERSKKYLGYTLFPQAGVALGMCIMARQLGESGDFISNIILFSVLVYEICGPLITKQALLAAGEITPQKADFNKIRREKLQQTSKRCEE